MFREIAGRSDLTNLTVFDGYPPASDRKAWERVPESYRRERGRDGWGTGIRLFTLRITWNFAARETGAALRRSSFSGGLC